MLRIGLTGGIGSGKTTVSDLFAAKGIEIIDTDIITHELLASDEETSAAIVEAFGKSTLDDNGAVDRKRLASTVFGNEKNKSTLENILHPRIRQHVSEALRQAEQQNPGTGYIIVVIPLLFETGFDQLIDRNLVVLADESIRIDRIKRRDSRKLDEIRSIINSQVDDAIRRTRADDIIENNSDISQLAKKVDALHEKYLAQQH